MMKEKRKGKKEMSERRVERKNRSWKVRKVLRGWKDAQGYDARDEK